MKKYLLLLLLLPFISYGQHCDTVTIGVQHADTIIYCITNASCHDTCNGSIMIDVRGNNQPYSFEWNNSNISTPGDNSRDSLCASSHLVTITDVNGNLVENSQISTVEDPPNFSVFEVLTNPTCFNDTNGSIALNIGGATPPYTYQWDNGVSSLNRNNLDSGIYVLTTMDANNCIRIDTFELINPAKIISTITADTLSCIGSCDGGAIVVPDFGVPPYTFEWDDPLGQITASADSLCYGLATVFITDDNGCLDTNAVFIENPDTLKLSNITIDSSCYQICDGELSVTIEGGTSPYDIEWSLGGNIFDTINTTTEDTLCPGNYQIKFTDANLCVDSVIIPLIERDSFLVQDWVIDDSCYNSCTAQITVQLMNQDNPPFTYNWSNGGNNTVISNLCSDTFDLVIIDNRLCSDTFNFFVEPGDSMYFDSVAVTHNNCYADEDGVISLINFNGGVQPLDYLWSNSETTSGINSLPSGFYNVTITDANGCSLDSSNIEVSQPDSLFATPSSEDVSCFGGSDGFIDIDLFGGVVPYFISWDIVIPDSTLIDTVSAGVYIYSVIDSNNCTITDIIIIEEPEELVLTDSIVNVLCKGDATGEIHLEVEGGVSPYQFSVDGGSTYQSQNYFDNLIAGSYSIIVKDANDCEITSNLLNVSEPLTVLSTGLTPPNLLCFGDTGTIILTVNGGTPNYSFLWGNGETSQNLNGVGAGNYSVWIKDANDCELQEMINIFSPDEIESNPSPVITDVDCFGNTTGSINVTIVGGETPYDYLWSNGETISSISNLSAGTYDLIVTDANDCKYEESIIVTEPDLLEATYVPTHVDCYGASTGGIDITVSGGTLSYNYNWSDLTIDEDLLNILAGTYTVTVTDANNCSVSVSATINEPSDITYTITLTNLVCNNVDEGEILITASGGTPGYSYSIDGGTSYQNGNNFTDLQADNYSVWIQDANGCEKHEVAVLNQPIGYSTSVIITDVEGCNGESTGVIDFTLSGNTPPYTYNWSNNESSSSIYNLTAGNYDVIVSDANNCEMTYSYLVTEPNALNLQYDILLASCEEKDDGAITTVVTGGTPPYSYSWGNEETSSDLFNIEKGTYSLTLEDSKGCYIETGGIEVGHEVDNGFCIDIPSGFTPNDDGIHDHWKIMLDDYSALVKVYNRWGQELFSSSDYTDYTVPWDGKYNGVDLPTATYYYVIELNESDKVFNGTVTIKR